MKAEKFRCTRSSAEVCRAVAVVLIKIHIGSRADIRSANLVSSFVNSTRATLVARVIQRQKREDLKDRYPLRGSVEGRFNDEPKF